MRNFFLNVLPENIRDHLRFYSQTIQYIGRKLFWFIESLLSKALWHHLFYRMTWKSNELLVLPDWLPFVPISIKGEKIVISKVRRNKIIPEIYGRPKIWPKATVLFPQKSVSLFVLDNVIATKQGQVFDYYGRTIKDVWHNPPIFFHKLFQRLFYGVDLKDVNDSNNLLELEEAIIIQQLTNKTYGHFLIEILPRMLIAKEMCDDELSIYFTVNHEVYRSALTLLGVDSARFVCADEFSAVKIKRAHIPRYTKRPGWLGCSSYLDQAINIIIEKVESQSAENNTFNDRIFVARPASATKSIKRSSRLLNVNEVEQELLNRGFKKVFPEKLPFNEQVLLFRNAKVVIGEHGSALFNTLFCDKNSLVFDIHSARSISILYDVLQSRELRYVPIMNPEGSMVKWSVQQQYQCSIPYLKEALDAYDLH